MTEIIKFLSENKWLVILINMVISVIVYIILLKICRNFLKKMSAKSNGIHVKYFDSLLKIILFVMEICYLMNLFDTTKKFSNTVLGGGAIILTVLSFGAQQAMGNIVSGFFISASKPYELEDKIKITSGGNILAEGIVKDITTRHTVIQTFDGQTCIIPNSVMDSAVIVNSTYTENVGNFLTVEISYESDVDKAMDILKKIIVSHELTLNDDKTSVSLSQMNDNGLLLKTTVWTKTINENFTACSDIRKQVLKEFNNEGISIPYNTIIIKEYNS